MGASPPLADETKWTDHVIKFEFPMRPVVWWIYVPSFAGIYKRNEEGWCCKNTAGSVNEEVYASFFFPPSPYTHFQMKSHGHLNGWRIS
jgi:hypothetical protein